MKAIILGGHGFIGRKVVAVLREKGHDAIPLSRKNDVDMLIPEKLNGVLRTLMPDVIFNCAAHVGGIHYVMQHAADVIRENMQMALNLYKAVTLSCPHTHVVNPLSNCSYPGDAQIHYEPDWWKGEPHHSVFAYATAKRFVYSLARCYFSQHGIRTSNFLVPNAFGVGDHVNPHRTHAISGLIVRMLEAHRKQQPVFEVWGTGTPVREWGYIDDIAEILTRAVNLHEDLLYPVNIAQGKGYSIRESAEAIQRAIGYRGQISFNTAFEDGAPAKVLDERRFRSLFPGYSFTPHAEAIQRTVEYYQRVLSGQ